MPAICGLLVLRLPIKQISAKIKPILSQISNNLVEKLLYITIDPLDSSKEVVPKIDLIHTLPYIYKTANSINPHLDVRILNPVDYSTRYRLRHHPSLIITNLLVEADSDATSSKVSEYLKFKFHDNFDQLPVKYIDGNVDELDQASQETVTTNRNNETYNNVAVGGTFDGIHVGHKLLFNEATMRCNKTLVVGVTSNNMLKSKILWELIAPVYDRIKLVENFLSEIDPNITIEVVPMYDIYGPTIEREQLHYLVVSEETKKGGQKVNEARVEKGWQPMEIGVIKLMESVEVGTKSMMLRLREKKVSSSISRILKLGTILNAPKPNLSIPTKPYMIGLTGGVASGKTAIADYLKTLDYGVINYDILGHKTYENIDSPVYKKILDFFGETILNPETKSIVRSELGKLVFGDKEKLQKLESFVWPAIYDLVDKEIDVLKEKHPVIVLESALLLESKQDKRVHQIWTTFVPPEEAVNRQVVSRGLSREEAEKRVAAQTDNLTRIRNSNAIFCSLWEPEFTRYQVKKCVEQLQKECLDKF